MNLVLIGNHVLRSAIRENLVSFPAQIPTLTKNGGVEERLVQLYFIRGWELRSIGLRFGLCKSTVRKIITDWKVRAVSAGHIQEVYPEALDALLSNTGAGIDWEPGSPSVADRPEESRAVAWQLQDPCRQSPRTGTA